jgi:hypothetical protein
MTRLGEKKIFLKKYIFFLQISHNSKHMFICDCEVECHFPNLTVSLAEKTCVNKTFENTPLVRV